MRFEVTGNLDPSSSGSEYMARGGIVQLFLGVEPEVLLDGPAGTGKSRGVCEYLNWICLNNPGCRVLCSRKTRVSMTDTVCATLEGVLRSVDRRLVDGASRQFRHSYKYPNGSEIVLAGMDNPTRLFSLECDIAYVNEAIELTLDEWESLHRALRNNKILHPHGCYKDGKMRYLTRLIGDTNPGHPRHWLKKRCDSGVTKRIISRHEDNPSLTADYLTRLSTLTGVRRKRLFEGMWAASEGTVYDDWNPDIHVVAKRMKNPRRVYGGVDWGWNDPAVLQVWGFDGDKRSNLLAEFYHRHKRREELIAAAKELKKEFGVYRWICDPSEPEFIDAFNRAGLDAVPAENEILAGISVVTERLKVQGDGRPRLTVYKDASVLVDESLRESYRPTGLVQEFDEYVWAKPRGKDDVLKDQPAEGSDHGMDAMRYVHMYVDRVNLSAPTASVTDGGAEGGE